VKAIYRMLFINPAFMISGEILVFVDFSDFFQCLFS